MSIRFVTGLPGHGKGLFNMEEIARFLGETSRIVVTSMTEIEHPKLCKLLEERYPGRNLKLNERLFYIDKRDVGEFYRYRGKVTLEKAPTFPKNASTKEKDEAYEKYFEQITDGQPSAGGVEYFITEAHRHFKADTWSEMADVSMFYLTQHRHFDDNVWVETQLPKQVVVQFRDLADECIEVTNHYKQRMGWFQKPGCIKVNRFYSVPKPGTKPEPYATGTFKLDVKGLASCYRTRGAVATGTGAPETDTTKKALPFWTIYAGAAALLAIAVSVIWFAPKLITHFMAAVFKPDFAATAMSSAFGISPTEAIAGTKNTKQPDSPVHAQKGPKDEETPQQATLPSPAQQTHATGYLTTKDGVIVLLSDGTRRSTVGHIVENITIKGESFMLKPKPVSALRSQKQQDEPPTNDRPRGGATAPAVPVEGA